LYGKYRYSTANIRRASIPLGAGQHLAALLGDKRQQTSTEAGFHRPTSRLSEHDALARPAAAANDLLVTADQ